MKTAFFVTVLSLALTGAVASLRGADSSAQEGPVTVHVTYRVLPGKEADLEAMLARAWEVYRTNNLVLPQPHILVQDLDEDKKPRFVELFSWASRSIAEHPTADVWTVWKEIHALCEPRSGHSAIKADKVKLLTPVAK